MYKTLFSIGFLVILAIVAKLIDVFVLNIVGVPGALIAGKREKNLNARYIFGSIVATICQSYVYLAYTAFVVSWTMLVISNQGISPLILWPIAFFVVISPIWWSYIAAIVEAKEDGYGTNAQIEALGFTVVLTFIGFFILAFAPSVMRAIYSWVPYVG